MFCFQKFNVSCDLRACQRSAVLLPGPLITTHLEFGVALRNQYVHGLEVVDVSVLLELLSDFCADLGHRHVQGVHRLNFRALYYFVLSLCSCVTVIAMNSNADIQLSAILGRISVLDGVHLTN